MDCLVTPIPEVKCTICIKIMQTKFATIKAYQTICTHHTIQTPKAKLISAKNNKIYEELENRDKICPWYVTLKIGTQGHLRSTKVTGWPERGHKFIIVMSSGIAESLFSSYVIASHRYPAYCKWPYEGLPSDDVTGHWPDLTQYFLLSMHVKLKSPSVPKVWSHSVALFKSY